MAAQNKGLGKGLGALISEVPASSQKVTASAEEHNSLVDVDLIDANKFQPRKEFDQAELKELSQSIKDNGIIVPLTVRKNKDRYELIAGERRLRASKLAGLDKIPCYVRQVEDQLSAEMALIENIQRSDLNPIEEGEGYNRLAKEFNMTQDEIAKGVGKARATIANSIRLLSLPVFCKEALIKEEINSGHAKLLLSLKNQQEQDRFARKIISEQLSVRQLEGLMGGNSKKSGTPSSSGSGKSTIPDEHLHYVTEQLQQALGTQVNVIPPRTGAGGKVSSGKLEIDIYSPDDLDRILDMLGLTDTY